jgi:hypothetical protein
VHAGFALADLEGNTVVHLLVTIGNHRALDSMLVDKRHFRVSRGDWHSVNAARVSPAHLAASMQTQSADHLAVHRIVSDLAARALLLRVRRRQRSTVDGRCLMSRSSNSQSFPSSNMQMYMAIIGMLGSH